MNQSAVIPRLDLVGGRPVTTFLNVSEVFGKQHTVVMRAIRSLDVPEDFGACNFARGSYLDDNNQSRPMYHITRDGFTLLAMGFTGKAAMQFKLAYIEAFNRMEAELAQPLGKRTDIHHHRGPVTDSGLDIRFQLDLTKIVLRPTPASLRVLQRITGVEVADLIDSLTAKPAASGDDAIDLLGRYLEERLRPSSIGRVSLAAVTRDYNQWRLNAGGTVMDSRELARALRPMGYSVIKRGGEMFINGFALEVQP